MRFYLISGILFFTLIAMTLSNGIKGTVVCFGDSITHGAKVNGHSWVYFLSKEHKDINFINAGRNGRKTSDKKELLPVLKKYPKADYYLIFLGVNDLKNGNDSMVNQCVENMEWIINKIKDTDKKAKIVILAPIDINLNTMSQLNVNKKYNENTKSSLVRLKMKYKELAKKDNLGFISLLKTVSPPNYVDGLHPDEKGQQQIADAVWSGLEKL
ncbi:MAG: SGNH/GDSL hydrolase family protein, partial [Ignavibacteriaceae bacterium]